MRNPMHLYLTVPSAQLLNEETFEIINIPKTELELEHSLWSISKWEMLWHEPYIVDRENLERPMTNEQLLSYLQCMTVNGEFDPVVYASMSADLVDKVRQYLQDPMTGTTFRKEVGAANGAIASVTSSEEIYYAMCKWRIPLECEHWHINRLLAFLRVFGEKENPKKLTQQQRDQEMYAKNAYRQQKAAARRHK